MLREKTVGASLCGGGAEGSLGASAAKAFASSCRRIFLRYGIKECVRLLGEFRWYRGIFRPEAVNRLQGFFICPAPKKSERKIFYEKGTVKGLRPQRG